MSVNFFMILGAALIFRYLAMSARSTLVSRLSRLLSYPVCGRQIIAVLRQHQDKSGAFRVQVLPFAGLELACDTLACAAFVAAVHLFPPSQFGPHDLALLRNGSLMVVSLAFAVDLLAFARTIRATFDSKPGREKRDSAA